MSAKKNSNPEEGLKQQKAELELLLGDDDGRKHFSLKNILKNEESGKKKKKKKNQEDFEEARKEEDFKVNLKSLIIWVTKFKCQNFDFGNGLMGHGPKLVENYCYRGIERKREREEGVEQLMYNECIQIIPNVSSFCLTRNFRCWITSPIFIFLSRFLSIAL